MERKNFKRLVLICMYIIGLVHWLAFTRQGNYSFDWAYIHQWLDVFRKAFLTGKIPYFATYYLSEFMTGKYIFGERFFATPFVIASPHIIFLMFMNVTLFLKWHLVLMYSVGFYGIYKWIEKLDLSPAAAVFLLTVGCFNGSIVSRMGVGHLQLAGYMFIPLYLWILNKFMEDEHAFWQRKLFIVLQYALFLFFVFLQGANHNFYQMVFVGLIVLAFYPRQLGWYILSIVLAGLLCSYIIWPNVFFGNYMCSDRIIFCGYGIQSGDAGRHLIHAANIFGKMSAAPINILYHIWEALTRAYTAANGATWEYNLYISLWGVVLVIGGNYEAWKKYKPIQRLFKDCRFLLGAGIIAVLSLHCILRYPYLFFQQIISLPAIDRLPSRMMLYPFTLLLIFAAAGFDQMFTFVPRRIRKTVVWLSLGMLLIILLNHSRGWGFQQTAINFSNYINQNPDVDVPIFKTVIYDKPGEEIYKTIVHISYLISVMSACVCVWGYFYLRKKLILKK